MQPAERARGAIGSRLRCAVRRAVSIPLLAALVAASPGLAAAALICAAVLAAPAAHARAGEVEPLSAFPQALLSVRTASKRVLNFRIWVADNPRRSEQGLMFVRRLDDHAGMLFPFAGTEAVAMWMKNTYIPLDMLFVDASGRITKIAKRTAPLSLDLIEAPPGTRAVVELAGGVCDRLGIGVGDRVLSGALPLAR